MSLLGISYSSFDDIAGSQLECLYPPSALGKEDYGMLSGFVILGTGFSGKVIKCLAKNISYINIPMTVHSAKYERNAFLFAFGFIFNGDGYGFEILLKKLSAIFYSLELESDFLSRARGSISNILRLIYDNTRAFGELYIKVNSCNYVPLKLSLPPVHPMKVHYYSVPILFSMKSIMFLSSLPWDISIRQLLPSIDGISSVQKLAIDAGMDVELVKRCIRVLLFYNCILISDIFRFSNTYELTSMGLTVLTTRQDIDMGATPCLCLSSALQRFCSVNDNHDLPSIITINSFLLRLRSDTTVGQVILELLAKPPLGADDPFRGLDIRRCLGFAQSRGLVRRVQEFCFSSATSSACRPLWIDINAFNAICSGRHCLDAICLRYHLSPKQVRGIPGIKILHQ